MRIIAGTARGRRIEAPPGLDTRPTLDRVRENLFNMLQLRVRDTRVLDLFAGSGALSLEALSRGASFAVLADRDRAALQTEKKNIEALRFQDRTRILPGEWKRATATLKAEGERFDLVFLDPPYAMTDLREVTDELLGLLSDGALIVIEHEAKAETAVSDELELVNERSWGYCGVRFYERKKAESGEA